jgi:glutamate-5-semialdehyde dehydrogenase
MGNVAANKTVGTLAEQIVHQAADQARIAWRTLSHTSGEVRSNALKTIAQALRSRSAEILSANEKDMENAKTTGMNSSMQDRLLLNADRIESMAHGAELVAALQDPLGEILRERTLPNGLHLQQLSVPFGVVGMVYEARPNVTVDAASILIMSGNAALLRGSSSAANSNAALIKVMRDALSTTSISPEVLQLIPADNRETTDALLHARGKVDLVIPRGSASLIRKVVDDSSVPTIETGAGICHVYVDKDADLLKALPILINSKTHRPSVCNAAETLLVHVDLAKEFLPIALSALRDSGVIIHADERTQKIAAAQEISVQVATDQDFHTEYNSLEMNVAVVDSLEAAADHIARFGTQHTEAIVTESKEAAAKFVALSDCAAVMINASTRFTDGEQMGFGAEIGISNQKLHARGPMGLEQMTTTTWIVRGEGQIRQ